MSLPFNKLVVSFGYIISCADFQPQSTACFSPLEHVVPTYYSRDLFLQVKHLCIAMFSLQCDLRSKIQHLQRDICLEVKHLMMLPTSLLAYSFLK